MGVPGGQPSLMQVIMEVSHGVKNPHHFDFPSNEARTRERIEARTTE